jgi:hypothetical protein
MSAAEQKEKPLRGSFRAKRSQNYSRDGCVQRWLPGRGAAQCPQCPGGVIGDVISQSKLFILYHIIFIDANRIQMHKNKTNAIQNVKC